MQAAAAAAARQGQRQRQQLQCSARTAAAAAVQCKDSGGGSGGAPIAARFSDAACRCRLSSLAFWCSLRMWASSSLRAGGRRRGDGSGDVGKPLQEAPLQRRCPCPPRPLSIAARWSARQRQQPAHACVPCCCLRFLHARPTAGGFSGAGGPHTQTRPARCAAASPSTTPLTAGGSGGAGSLRACFPPPPSPCPPPPGPCPRLSLHVDRLDERTNERMDD